MRTRNRVATEPSKCCTNESNEVKEVRALWEEAQANALLQTGKWRLLHGGVAHADLGGYQAKPCWIMGRFKS